jgi:hypothetical protein
MTLARTESMRAYRGASADTMGQLQERGIVTGYVWLAALGPRCCIACMARHGTRYTVPPDDFHPACRCICRPEANPDLVPGGGWKGKTGPAWFAEQPEAIQRKMLVTDERFAAYRDGVSLSDMTMIRHSPIWGNSVAIRPSRDLVNAPRRERHPLNPRVFKGKDGIWGSDELPVMEWEAAEARVVLASEIIASLGASPSILRLSIAKRFEMLSKRPKTGPLLDSLSDLVPGWSYLGREPRGEVWNLLFPGEGHQNLLVFGPDKTGSWNVITAHPLRPSQIKRLEGSSWMGKRGEK